MDTNNKKKGSHHNLDLNFVAISGRRIVASSKCWCYSATSRDSFWHSLWEDAMFSKAIWASLGRGCNSEHTSATSATITNGSHEWESRHKRQNWARPKFGWMWLFWDTTWILFVLNFIFADFKEGLISCETRIGICNQAVDGGVQMMSRRTPK